MGLGSPAWQGGLPWHLGPQRLASVSYGGPEGGNAYPAGITLRVPGSHSRVPLTPPVFQGHVGPGPVLHHLQVLLPRRPGKTSDAAVLLSRGTARISVLSHPTCVALFGEV